MRTLPKILGATLIAAGVAAGMVVVPAAEGAPFAAECEGLYASASTVKTLKPYIRCRADVQDAKLDQILANQGASSPPVTTTAPSTTTAPPASGFPDATNTGVPSGTVLTAYTGPMTITTAGTVIDAKTITGDLVIKAAGVTVTRSSIVGSISTDENSTGYSFTLTDSNVDAGNRQATGVGAVNFTVDRVEVVGGNRSMNCWKNCTITNSWVHGQFTDKTGVAHESGIRMGAGTAAKPSVIKNNTITCDAPDVAPDAGCSASLTGYGDFATVQYMTVDGNFFPGTTGGYCAYGGASAGKPYPNANHVIFRNNVFGKTRTNDHGKPDCAYYGAATAFGPASAGNEWINNTYTDGTAVPRP